MRVYLDSISGHCRSGTTRKYRAFKPDSSSVLRQADCTLCKAVRTRFVPSPFRLGSARGDVFEHGARTQFRYSQSPCTMNRILPVVEGGPPNVLPERRCRQIRWLDSSWSSCHAVTGALTMVESLTIVLEHNQTSVTAP